MAPPCELPMAFRGRCHQLLSVRIPHLPSVRPKKREDLLCSGELKKGSASCVLQLHIGCRLHHST